MEISNNKILVLCMTCNKPEFKQMENIIRNTWAKEIIDGKIKNMKFFFYTSTEEKERIDYYNNKIYVKSGDEIFDTFNKTKKCIKLIDKSGLEYDYIVRVNTSTFINTILLNNYISIMKQTGDTRILCSMLVKANDKVFPCGKVLVFNKEHIKTILSSKINNRSHLNDDEIYGKIFCENITDYKELVKIFKVPGDPIYFNWNNKHRYNYTNYEIDNIKKNIFYSVRSIYENRDQECVSMLAIYNILSNIKYTFDDIIDIYFNNVLLLVDNGGNIDRCISYSTSDINKEYEFEAPVNKSNIIEINQ